MRHFLYIVLFILLQPMVSLGQSVNIDSAQTVNRYSEIKFEIKNVDTVVTHYVSGKYNTPGYKHWDSTKIWADIILINLPPKVDLSSLKIKVQSIMKDKGINRGYVFRDASSSMLFRMSSLFAAQELKKHNGYLGQYKLD